MDAKVKKLWVNALRSRKFRKGTKCLRPTANTFCCLGVLSELALRRKVINNYEYEDGSLPDAVRDWAGLSDVDPDVKFKGEKLCLSELNDGNSYANGKFIRKPLPFSRIADIIEKQL